METNPGITQNGDKDSLGPTSKHPILHLRGV